MSDPITAAIAVIDGALKDVAGTQPVFMPAQARADALVDLVRVETQVAELRMRILAVSDDVAETTGARDAAAWLAHAARLRSEDVRAESRLATALDRDRPRLSTAVRDGEVNLAQSQVIHHALTRLPADTPADTITEAEAVLVGYAADFGPRELARLGRGILDVVAPDVADELDAKHLQDLEAHAEEKTRLTIRRLGDGTTRISARIPDAAGTRLATYLHAYTNPRVSTRSQSDLLDHREPHSDLVDHRGDDPVTRPAYPRRLGEAFCRLLEHADPQRMPLHGGDATTLVVTIPLASLKRDLATAGLLDDPDDGRITANEARRLACTAQIVPAVLGGRSKVLDLGRARRLFTSAQRKALLIRDRTCRAEGCEIPGTWAEAHHWVPWSTGGHTDLKDGVLLCSHHHHRAHDPAYDTERLTNGDVRFHRRR